MTPNDLSHYLSELIQNDLKISVMIWGPPGIGKSSIVAQIAQQKNINFVDLRLSQLAPTDLRGLPVPQDGVSKWFPPEFLPTSGKGILFLDELNMAPPTMQGMAQQLILDRKVGSYELPEGWFVWAAGNRKEDKASVFDMPAPLANRFLHLEAFADLESFKRYALEKNFSERIISFLSYRPALLHQLDNKAPAWPSPRSWEMASQLLRANLKIAPVVGEATAAEFESFEKVYGDLPDIKLVFSGESALPFPEEPSARYALTTALVARCVDAREGLNAFKWLSKNAPIEWTQLYIADLFEKMRTTGPGEFALLVSQDAQIREFLKSYQKIVMG